MITCTMQGLPLQQVWVMPGRILRQRKDSSGSSPASTSSSFCFVFDWTQLGACIICAIYTIYLIYMNISIYIHFCTSITLSQIVIFIIMASHFDIIITLITLSPWLIKLITLITLPIDSLHWSYWSYYPVNDYIDHIDYGTLSLIILITLILLPRDWLHWSQCTMWKL